MAIMTKAERPSTRDASDEQVEASAAALSAIDNPGRTWPDALYYYQQEEYRIKARAALNAVAPTAPGR